MTIQLDTTSFKHSFTGAFFKLTGKHGYFSWNNCMVAEIRTQTRSNKKERFDDFAVEIKFQGQSQKKGKPDEQVLIQLDEYAVKSLIEGLIEAVPKMKEKKAKYYKDFAINLEIEK